MLKVAIFTHTFPPEIGAAPLRLAHMAKGLAEAGFRVEIYTGMPNYPTGRIFPSYQNKFFITENHSHYTIYRHWIYPLKSNRKAHRLFNMLSITVSIFRSLPRILRFQPNICIVQYPPIIFPFSVGLLAKIARAKLIVNVSDLWPEAIAALEILPKDWRYRILLKVEHFLYKNASACLAQSQEIEKYIRQKGQTNVVLYRTGVNTAEFKPNLQKAPTPKPFTLVYMGVLGLAHNVAEIIRRIDFAMLEAQFHIYGEGFERSAIEELISQLPNDTVQLHPLIAPETVAETLSTFHAVLISQKRYLPGTLPSKLYEAMAAGVPVLFHGAGEGAEIVRQTQCGLVSAPENFGELAENIRTLLHLSPNERQSMGERGRIRAIEEFDRSVQLQRLVQQLQQITQEKQT